MDNGTLLVLFGLGVAAYYLYNNKSDVGGNRITVITTDGTLQPTQTAQQIAPSSSYTTSPTIVVDDRPRVSGPFRTFDNFLGRKSSFL